MNIRKLGSVVVVAATLGLAGVTPAFAATATTIAPATTKAAAPATKAVTPTTKAAMSAKKGTGVKTKNTKPVVAGNFCKKKLVGTQSMSKAGVALTCRADAKGKPRWTK